MSRGVAFAQIGIIGFDGQIELETLRLYGLPEDAPAILYGCPSVPAGTRTLALETSWDLPSLVSGATANVDVNVPARDGATSPPHARHQQHRLRSGLPRVEQQQRARDRAQHQRFDGGSRRGPAGTAGDEAAVGVANSEYAIGH
ncbi:hypothetical protein [Falsiroseomonas oryzae]|uniref:hypothetical protein n=1 Tax=Falsiroseomonas oryzae TaxID=2766473 RepID=UPI0022EAC808|nr:hypothetical protein [Roseomonas sp. MO-31]